MENNTEIPHNEAVHTYFGLTRASYLVMPRVALQSMPQQWQRDFIALVEEMSILLPQLQEMEPASYTILPRGDDGKYTKSKFPSYRHNKLAAILQ